MQIADEVATAGAIILDWRTGRWLAPSEVRRPAVMLFHGFNSSGEHFTKQLAPLLDSYGFDVGIVNYDTYEGIDYAAHAIWRRLTPLLPSLSRSGFAIVGHSLGGLVARAIVKGQSAVERNALRAVVTLGTPHSGLPCVELRKWKRLSSLVCTIGESMSGAKEKYPACLTARELLNLEPTIAHLNDGWKTPRQIKMLSVSGGNAELFAATTLNLRGRVMNKIAQRLIGNVLPNDGLVPETSANLSNCVTCPAVAHERAYPSYPLTSHNQFAFNPDVADVVCLWLVDVMSAPSPNA